MWILIALLTFTFLFIGVFQLFANITPKKKYTNEKQKVDNSKLFKYTIDKNSEQTKLLVEIQYKDSPPLRPERFRRRVKMLWGIDVNDYPADAQIWFGLEYYRLSVKYQTVMGFYQFHSDSPFEFSPPPQNIYNEFRNYLLYNDPNTYKKLEEWRKSRNNDELYYYDILTIIYNSVLTVNPQLIRYIDKYSESDFCYLHNMMKNMDVPTRVSDIKGDLLQLYIKEQIGKNRLFAGNWSEENGMWLGFDLNQSSYLNLPEISAPYALYKSDLNRDSGNNPWKVGTEERGVAANLSYMLQLKTKQINKTIIKYMSGQLDYDGEDSILEFYKPRHAKIRTNIKSNNYYGYAILREFCENPMREMPTLEKIGTNFTAKVKDKNTLLLLEPFAVSFDIDTVQPNETFKAYEMGHDDYYFIEIEKPVESPVADHDGYAMILDRKETVYGYLPKKQVTEYTSQDVLQENTYTDKSQSKRGVINDKDGYVNIRKEPDTQSEIVGKIRDKELFNYWQTDSNWYIIETKDGIRGYVYKDRIREKYETEGWVIDE